MSPTTSLLSVTEAASVLGVSRQRVHQIMDEGQLGFVWVGATRALDRSEVARFKATRRRAQREPGQRP